MTKAKIILEDLISSHGDLEVHGVALFSKEKGAANVIVGVHPKGNKPNALFVFDYIKKLGARRVLENLKSEYEL